MDWPFADVFLARHGETEWNVAGRRQGRLDSPLTALGRQQAESVAAIADERGSRRPDSLFASPLGRARATADVVANRLGLGVQTIAGLAEIDHGDMAGLTSSEIEQRWPGALAERAGDKYRWRFPGGESYADANDRVGGALATIATTGGIRPMIVCHEMVGRLVAQLLLDLPPDEGLRRTLSQGTVLVIEPAISQATVIRSATGRPDGADTGNQD